MNDLYDMIQDIIHEEVTYLRHYIGEIVDVNDPLNKGRVKITIPELGLDTPALAIWCYPRQGNSMSIPVKGKYAEVYWINGDRTKGVYLYPASEIVDNVPTQYDGNVKNHLLFESPETGEYIKYNDNDKTLEINFSGEINITSATKINLLGAAEAFVNGTSHHSALSTLCATIAAIAPSGSSAANITALLAAFATFNSSLSSMLSTKIKGE